MCRALKDPPGAWPTSLAPAAVNRFRAAGTLGNVAAVPAKHQSRHRPATGHATADVSDSDEGAPDPRRCFRGSNRLIDLADDPYNEDITVQIDVFEGDNESIELTSSTSWQAATRPSDDDLSGSSSCVRGGPIATE